ncbi:WGR domain-containing protein [Sphingobium yanoikuyae]|uniref:WGR domain-containing protein n=1 Tax=Sphingobium yanoikuyae TaxID=13690 RepID=UPI0009BF2C74|nr:WGR domain-containing protein [Sphingobium yanoikuyae]
MILTANLMPIALVALDPDRNVRRRYEIDISIDLFGVYIVETRWGRIGARGQSKRLSFADRAGAERYVGATLRRRHSAERRIGVPYRAACGTALLFSRSPILAAPAAPEQTRS